MCRRELGKVGGLRTIPSNGMRLSEGLAGRENIATLYCLSSPTLDASREINYMQWIP